MIAALDATTTDDELVIKEATMIEDSVVQAGQQGGYRDLFTGGKTQHFQRMVVGASGQFFQQFTGCNASIYYATLLFERTIFDGKRQLSLILGGVFASVYALSTIPGLFMVDRIGRRKLFLVGVLGQGSAFIISFACLVKPTTENAKGAAVGLFLFIFFFAWSILPLPWIYAAELSPIRTRTAATSVSTMTNWICNFAVVMFTPVFTATSPWGTYLYFAIMNFAAAVPIYFFYPETAGRALEEIDIIYAKSFVEGKFAFQVANSLPKLSLNETHEQALQLGLRESISEKDVPEHDSRASNSDREETV